ncbi:Hsp70 family protein [Rhodococcus sp. IEGM 1401]|uniref:Hsp70 family protein n=1 Tax=unclassified Rhodococcus (in: high G+C Gram-positive bacteria) TaxID=192944 RepID=UPI0022B421AC|nr:MULTISPECIES: Hsp70 family protein [unclassified Rhodococcus (in: high G+C Gram-positive bacteria)]MCZ4560843.1 Hsp70 family protein [Rhodococcus sp. IEGM 1401]MDI9920983.1 Hsp70 family protein [Rhodococcus sp. IEGM 1372]MDV8033416.1 Hsp70 family protein [Rhodococcus sp. IEGM 1414]
MSAVPDVFVLGASLGSSGLRSVIGDNARPGAVLEVHEPVASRPAPNGLAPDPWDAVITSVHNLATEYASADFHPVLALRESDPKTAYEQDFSDGVVLVSELGAQLGALRETRVLAGERCVALFDVGASGTSVSVVDIDSGDVLASRRTDALGGDDCDRVLCDHLIATFGAVEALTVEARRRLVHDVRDGKHELALLRNVSIIGPFVGGRASLWRGNLDELIVGAVHRAVSMAVDVLDAVGAQGVHVDAIVAVGGGANMQIIRQVLFDAVPMPVYVPEQPELLAAHGAAGIARTLGLRPAPAPPEVATDRFAAVDRDSADLEVAAVASVVSKRPRHSDTSSKRMTRANKSRHVGGALAALVAVCAAGTVVTAAARTSGDDPAPSVDTSQDSSQTTRPQSVVPAAGGAPADRIGSSLPLATTTAQTSPPIDAPATSSSSEVPTTTDAESATATRRTAVTTSSPPDVEETTAADRPTRDRSTAVPTTVAPVSTIRPTTPRPATTTRPTTTTRSARTLNLPFPDFDFPRR